jgi:hypothetical protein
MADKKSDIQRENVDLIGVKDSPGRSLAKAISWRIIASLTTFLITFIIFRRYTDKTLDETLETSFWVLFFDVILKIIIYYFHERMWTNIVWGKYWKRDYWKQRAWKKLYRNMHKD